MIIPPTFIESNNTFFFFFRVRLDTTYFYWNWKLKHCSKIIFKCVNNAMRPILNNFFWIKWLRVPWTVREQCCYSAWNVLLQFVNSDNCLPEMRECQKRRREKRWKVKMQTPANVNPNTHLIINRYVNMYYTWFFFKIIIIYALKKFYTMMAWRNFHQPAWWLIKPSMYII